MKIKQFLTFLLLSVSIILPVSCGDEYMFATESDCNSCMEIKPEKGPIFIDITTPFHTKGVVLKVFKGLYTDDRLEDDSQAIYIDTVFFSPVQVDVPVNENYSAVAEYNTDGKKIMAVDGSELKLYSVKSTCDKDCWIYKGGTMDCRLKYEFE